MSFDISTISKSIVGFFGTLGVTEGSLAAALSGTGVVLTPLTHVGVVVASAVAGFLVWLKRNGPEFDKVAAIIERYLEAQAAKQAAQVPAAPVVAPVTPPIP